MNIQAGARGIKDYFGCTASSGVSVGALQAAGISPGELPAVAASGVAPYQSGGGPGIDSRGANFKADATYIR